MRSHLDNHHEAHWVEAGLRCRFKMQVGLLRLVTQYDHFDPLPQADLQEVPMNTRNEDVVRLYIEGLWNDLRYELIEQILAPDVVAHAADGTQEYRRERFRQVIPYLRSAFPDLHLSIEEMITDGDRVAFRLRARGTHTGEAFGIAPSGKALDLPEWFFMRLSDGKIAEYWYLRDHALLHRQLTQN